MYLFRSAPIKFHYPRAPLSVRLFAPPKKALISEIVCKASELSKVGGARQHKLAVTDMGEFSLKGIKGKQRLFQCLPDHFGHRIFPKNTTGMVLCAQQAAAKAAVARPMADYGEMLLKTVKGGDSGAVRNLLDAGADPNGYQDEVRGNL